MQGYDSAWLVGCVTELNNNFSVFSFFYDGADLMELSLCVLLLLFMLWIRSWIHLLKDA